MLLLNRSAAAETRYGKELRLHLNVTFSLLGKCHLRVYLPPGADVRPYIVYLLSCGVISGGLKRANRGRPAFLPLTQPSSNYLLDSPSSDSHSIHLLWPFHRMWQPSNVSVSSSLKDGWRLLPLGASETTLISHKSKAESDHWSGLNFRAGLIGPLYELWLKQNVTLWARLPVLSALCVTPINLYAPPSSLPFLCSITDTIERSWAGGAQVSDAAIGPLLCFPNRRTILKWFQPWSEMHQKSRAPNSEKIIKMAIILHTGY